MSDSGSCGLIEGGGCSSDAPAQLCDTADSAAGSEDTASSALVEGGGCSCESASPGGLWAVVLAVLLSRRWTVLALLLLPRTAPALDAQHLQTTDGGTFPALMEITRSPPWSVRGALSTSHTRRPVVLRSASGEALILDSLQTIEGGISLAVGPLIRVGIGTPIHTRYTLYETPRGPTRGDMALWTTVNLSDPEADTQRGWTVAFDVPSSDASLSYLGDPGSVRGILASTRDLDPLVVGVNLGIRLQQPTELPGMTWASRWEGGVGVDWSITDRDGLTGELIASAPLDLDGIRGAWPAEVLLTARRRVSDHTTIHLGGGAGLTPGIGSPAWRVTAMISSDAISGSDRDGDGLPNLRDACASRPEDVDGYRDADGCPDPDNDRDTILDLYDACPMAAEVVNGHEDTDGCPDAIAVVAVTVRSRQPELLETVRLSLNDRQREVLPGEPTDFRLVPGGRVVMEATAAGHEHLLEELPLTEGGRWNVELVMEPIRYGEVRVSVTDAAGSGIAAALSDGTAIPAGGLTVTRPTGQAEIAASAEGYLPGSDTVFVSATAPAEVVIALADAGVRLEGSQLLIGEVIQFELDSAALSAGSTAALDALAAWLAEHPEVLLLRIEGLADALGSPSYNHRLSIQRAASVQERLVAAGIDPERLEAIGSGEALADGAESDRSVRFLVVVWSEDAGFSDAQRPAP